MTSPSPEDQLLRLRRSIDNVDAVLIHTLAERFKLTQAVGELKAEHAMPPSDPRARRRRSPACGASPRRRSSTRSSPRSSSPS